MIHSFLHFITHRQTAFSRKSTFLCLKRQHNLSFQLETVHRVWYWNTDLVSPLEVFHFIKVNIKVKGLLDLQQKVNAETCAALQDGLIGHSETQRCLGRTVCYSAWKSHFSVVRLDILKHVAAQGVQWFREECTVLQGDSTGHSEKKKKRNCLSCTVTYSTRNVEFFGVVGLDSKMQYCSNCTMPLSIKPGLHNTSGWSCRT